MKNHLNILIVDDNPMMTRTLRDILQVEGYRVTAAHSGFDALARIAEHSFDCVISDIKMPDMNGVELYRAIRKKNRELPVVLMTAYSTESLIAEGMGEGLIAVLQKPLDIRHLLNFLTLLNRKSSIVIVDDDPAFCKTLSEILQEKGFSVRPVTDPHEKLDGIVEEGQILLLDMLLNHISGLDILKDLRRKFTRLPVILISGHSSEATEEILNAHRYNIHDFMKKPLDVEQLLEALTEIEHQRLGEFLSANG